MRSMKQIYCFCLEGPNGGFHLSFLGQHEVGLCQVLAYIIRHLRMAAGREVTNEKWLLSEAPTLRAVFPLKSVRFSKYPR